MKEAAGEANMTVITIVLIAIVLAIGTVVVTNLMNSIEHESGSLTTSENACVKAGGTWANGTCTR